MKNISYLLFVCFLQFGCTIQFKPISLTELDNHINNIYYNTDTVNSTLYPNNADPEIRLKLYNKDILNFISTDECSYKYIRFIKELDIYVLKYEDYNAEGTILVSKLNGGKKYFDGDIVFNVNKTNFITYSPRQNYQSSLVQLYSINKFHDIQLLYSYKTSFQDPVSVIFKDNKTAIICLKSVSATNQYLLEF